MTRAVVWSEQAEADFYDILAWIMPNSAAGAASVERRIYAATDLLANTPTGRPGRVGRMYEKVVPRLPYILAYVLTDNEVRIVRIVHGARDWPAGGWPKD